MTDIETTLGGRPVTIHTGRSADPASNPLPLGLLGLDVESTYMTDLGQWDPDFRIRLVQFGTEDEAWVFDMTGAYHKACAEDYLYAPQRSFCSHSNMDVLAIATQLGIDLTGRNVDTLSLATMADPDREQDRDLKTLATAYGMPELEEGERLLHERFMELWVAVGGKRNAKKAEIQAHGWATIPADDPVYLTYAGLDAIACRRLAPILLAATQAPAELLRKEQWLDTESNRITLRGLRVDVEALDAFQSEVEQACTEAKEAAEVRTGGVNIAGPKVLDWLEQHGVDWSTWPGALTDTGRPSLAKENVHLLDGYPLDEVAQGVVGYMRQFKANQDAMNKCRDIRKRLVWEDGIARIHPQLNPRGASTTARMSSSGPNVQNFSKKNPRHRGLFIPDPGHVLATIDFDQVELRVVAALAREESMIATIHAGGDLHSLTVDELAQAGVTITRQTAKIVNFLIVYGGGPKALHEQTGIPLDEAKAIIDAWRDRYRSISALAAYLAMETAEVRTISNRRLPVTRVKGKGARVGEIRSYANINYMVQSSARELLVDAWWRFSEEFGRRGMVWWPIHDELVLQVPEDQLEPVLADAERAMTMDFMGVPITASAIVLRDEHGVSRWMPGDYAEKIAKGEQS